MAGNTTLKDAVEPKVKEAKEKQLDEEVKTFSIDGLSLDDFKPIEQKAARSPHPFEGYPNEMIKVGEIKSTSGKSTKDIMIPKYAIVALNPKEPVFKDPSGRRQTINKVDKDGKKTGQSFTADVYEPHNVCVRNFEEGYNTTVSFDRELVLKDGSIMKNVAFVLDHSVRAQLFFKLDHKGNNILVDRRYMLIDKNQIGRLRRVFQMIVNPKIKKEQLASAISEGDEDAMSNLDSQMSED